MASACGEMIMRCFHARTNAHVLHLSTKSYAVHKALQEFYDGIIPLVDNLAEAYQGEYGLITVPAMKYTAFDDPLDMLEDLIDWVDENREDVCDETYCQNIIDEIVALTRSAQYKLRFLK